MEPSSVFLDKANCNFKKATSTVEEALWEAVLQLWALQTAQ